MTQVILYGFGHGLKLTKHHDPQRTKMNILETAQARLTETAAQEDAERPEICTAIGEILGTKWKQHFHQGLEANGWYADTKARSAAQQLSILGKLADLFVKSGKTSSVSSDTKSIVFSETVPGYRVIVRLQDLFIMVNVVENK